MAGSGVSPASELGTQIGDAVRRCWGYENLRPLQREAIEAGLRGVGVKKLADLGPVFTEAIRSYVAGRNE